MVESKLKKCSGKNGCGKLLPATEEYFSKRQASPDGLQGTCKKCRAEYSFEYRKEHPEYFIKYNALYRTDHKEYYAEYMKVYDSQRHKENRELCLDKYGHTCVWDGCGIIQSEFLAFDHPNNDGGEHRKITGSGTHFVEWLIKKGFPQGIVQILCHNHNALKESERKRALWVWTPGAIANRKHQAKIKLEVLTEYSPNKILCCSCPGCGIRDIGLLTADHINGGGTRHIKQLGGGGSALYDWLRDNGFPLGFQTLCWNCNKGRSSCGGNCPHNLVRKVSEVNIREVSVV